MEETFLSLIDNHVSDPRAREALLALHSDALRLPPEIVELLRDVASGPCMPDLRGRAGAALVRRDLVGACSRCGGSGYERIGDGSVNAWGACEVCRPATKLGRNPGDG